jgi:hypothetical protein
MPPLAKTVMPTYVHTEKEARNRVFVEALCYKSQSRGFDSRLRQCIFSIGPIFRGALWPWRRFNL